LIAQSFIGMDPFAVNLHADIIGWPARRIQ